MTNHKTKCYKPLAAVSIFSSVRLCIGWMVVWDGETGFMAQEYLSVSLEGVEWSVVVWQPRCWVLRSTIKPVLLLIVIPKYSYAIKPVSPSQTTMRLIHNLTLEKIDTAAHSLRRLTRNQKPGDRKVYGCHFCYKPSPQLSNFIAKDLKKLFLLIGICANLIKRTNGP